MQWISGNHPKTKSAIKNLDPLKDMEGHRHRNWIPLI